jgi:hypothetical protein
MRQVLNINVVVVYRAKIKKEHDSFFSICPFFFILFSAIVALTDVSLSNIFVKLYINNFLYIEINLFAPTRGRILKKIIQFMCPYCTIVIRKGQVNSQVYAEIFCMKS